MILCAVRWFAFLCHAPSPKRHERGHNDSDHERKPSAWGEFVERCGEEDAIDSAKDEAEDDRNEDNKSPNDVSYHGEKDSGDNHDAGNCISA